MPFFEGARDFEIKGGSFYDVKGDQHNHRTDNSFRLSGTGNTANFSPNLSRQDNRTYNVSHTTTGVNGHYNYGGNFVSQPLPPDFQEFQAFLAWRQQQGLLSAPPLQRTMPSQYDSPMFGQGMSGPNDTRGFGQSSVPGTFSSPQLGQQYPSPNGQHSQYPPHFPHSQTNAWQNYAPPPPANWDASMSPGHLHQPHEAARPAEHPSQYRSQSQPPPDNTTDDPLSEFSEVLSEPDHTNPIPGFGALCSVQDRFLQQAQSAAKSDQTPPRPHSTSNLPTPSNIPAGTQPSSSSLPQPAHGPQAPSVTVSPDTPTTRANFPPNMPPPVNTATKPPTPQPHLQPLPTPLPAVSQAPHQQSVSLQLPQPQPGNKLKHHSSSSSFSSSSSNEERHQRMNSMPLPLNGSTSPSTQVSNSSSMPVASPPASPTHNPPTNVASSPFRHENGTPLSAPTPLVTGPMTAGPVLIPTTNSAPVAAPFSAFPTLRPLNSLPQVQLSSQGIGSPDEVVASLKKKKKKTFFQKMGLGRKKSKEGKLVS